MIIKLMKGKLKIKLPDVIIILLAAALTAFSAFKLYVNPRNNIQVIIEGPRRGLSQNQKWIFPINAEETVEVSGPLGITVVRVHGDAAWVESSPCKNQVCMTAGFLRQSGEFAACLPNMILLAIEGHDDREVDGVAW